MSVRDVDVIDEETQEAYEMWSKDSGAASYLLSSYALFRLGYLWALRQRGLRLQRSEGEIK